MRPFIPRRRALVPALFAAFALSFMISCNKIPPYLQVPPGTILRDPEIFPMQQYIDSALALSAENVLYTLSSVGIFDPTIPHAEVPGQAEFALGFHTSVPAALTSLAVLLPSSVYTHTVTLWDSASGAVLAQADITTHTAGKWASVSLALQGQAVPLTPGKGYIIGVNSLAVGNTEDVLDTGNEVYLLYGIYDFSQGQANSSFRNIMPIVEGPITFESSWLVNFDPPATAPAFPGTQPKSGDPNSVFGIVDFGYIPAP